METLLEAHAHMYLGMFMHTHTHTCMHCIYGDVPFIMSQSMTDDMGCPGGCQHSVQ